MGIFVSCEPVFFSRPSGSQFVAVPPRSPYRLKVRLHSPRSTQVLSTRKARSSRTSNMNIAYGREETVLCGASCRIHKVCVF